MKYKFNFSNWKKDIWKNKVKILLSLVLLAIAIVSYHYAGLYVDKVATNTIGDLIIDNTKAINLNFLYDWGFKLILLIFFSYSLFFRVNDLHIVIAQYSLLFIARNAFICLTHLKTPIDAIYANSGSISNYIGFNNDLFFSGHTAFPFLGFLIFKGQKIRWFFLAASILMGATVLLSHTHYSIDVFAAPFITYGVFKIGEWLFSRKSIK